MKRGAENRADPQKCLKPACLFRPDLSLQAKNLLKSCETVTLEPESAYFIYQIKNKTFEGKKLK